MADDIDRRDGNLDDVMRPRPECVPDRRGFPMVDMAYRIDTRTIGIARLAQGIECPPVSPVNGEARRAISLDLHPADVLEQLFGPLNVGQEICWGLLRGPAMLIAMTRQLMPT